jgi:tetratricopeptide (TPR) repeat protein
MSANGDDEVLAVIEQAYALDREGHEHEAVRHYDRAWALGVPEPMRRRFVVGYGSTLRNVGRLEEAVALLGGAIADDPGYPAYQVFLGLALHSSGEHAAAAAALLEAILEVAAGADLDGYQRAIAEYQRELLDRALTQPTRR